MQTHKEQLSHTSQTIGDNIALQRRHCKWFRRPAPLRSTSVIHTASWEQCRDFMSFKEKCSHKLLKFKNSLKKIQPRAYLAWPECHSVDLDMQQSLKAELSVTRLNQYRCLNYTSFSVTVTKKVCWLDVYIFTFERWKYFPMQHLGELHRTEKAGASAYVR